MTPAKQRIAEYRARQKAKGMKEIAIHLTPEALKALRLLLDTSPDSSMGDVISSALVAAARKQPKAPPPTPVSAPATVLISATEAAKRLQVTVIELSRWHKERRGPQPKHIKRRWLYDERELDEWLAAERRKADEDTAP